MDEFDFDRVQSSPAAATLAESMHAREFETQFCRDFHCCGLRLFDLHELLQHYEECHVRFEDDIDDDATTSDNDGLAENESDVFDDDSWSDPDSAPASPSSQTAPAGSTTSAAALETLLGGGGSSATRARMAAAAAASTAHLYPAFQSHYSPAFGAPTNHNSLPPYPLGHPQHQEVPFIHSTHPLYRHPSESSSVGDVDESYPTAMSDNNGATAHALDAFAASFHGPIKRKAAVSLADIYANDYDNNDDMSKTMDRFSAFSNTTLGSSRSNSISSSTTTSSTSSDCGVIDRSRYASDPLIPLSAATNDRFTLESNRRSTMGSIYSKHTGGPYIHASATDLMRQTEEVFSLVEDLSRTGNVNTGDKPYRCTMPGCDKAYKNPNGLKYHNLHGHCTNNGSEAEALEARPYVCTFLDCGKRYKNLNGLKYHIEHSHPNLTAALRAHQSGLINPHMFGTYPSQAAMTIAAALQAVNSSPMMMAAVNAIMAAQAATATANHVGGQGDMGASGDDSGHGIGTGTGTGAGTGSTRE
ncbi:hypothetical protein BGZ98_009830 [Dissophora globulifera]|nr:hypothetical protein BGZ98_009830 [Dissophora globulifera]